ncbi:DNA-protecting protein DprA [Candidatus Wolfebacteria bacterium]|nr:MAG: DNA-protecting protein DprA [Candidatus Wolfebacteria bacterium]
MESPLVKLNTDEFPPLLHEINDPPKELWRRGNPLNHNHTFLAIVGARKYSNYGKEICEKLIAGLNGYPVTIISGLALGIDGIAHRAALANNIHTVAIPGSGLNTDVLYPRSHVRLADEILKSGGALISEFEPDFKATQWSFPKRNRIMAGMSHAVLVIEAERRSGTLITSRLATEYNRDVFTIPGSVFSKNTEGPHMLIRNGATPITCTEDLLEALGFEAKEVIKQSSISSSPDEQRILDYLSEPRSRDEIAIYIDAPIHELNVLLSTLEIKGLIIEQLGKISTVK